MIVPESLVQLAKPWADFYSHSKVAATVVTFLHVGGLLLAGGLAIAADRGTYRTMRMTTADRPYHLGELAAVHRWVIAGLVATIASGFFLLAADLDTFLGSWIFWTKMALVASLLINGLVMTRAERRLAADGRESSPDWRRLHRAAVTSLALWFAITLLGVVLTNIS